MTVFSGGDSEEIQLSHDQTVEMSCGRRCVVKQARE